MYICHINECNHVILLTENITRDRQSWWKFIGCTCFADVFYMVLQKACALIVNADVISENMSTIQSIIAKAIAMHTSNIGSKWQSAQKPGSNIKQRLIDSCDCNFIMNCRVWQNILNHRSKGVQKTLHLNNSKDNWINRASFRIRNTQGPRPGNTNAIVK
jgi:hypothetical protein